MDEPQPGETWIHRGTDMAVKIERVTPGMVFTDHGRCYRRTWHLRFRKA